MRGLILTTMLVTLSVSCGKNLSGYNAKSDFACKAQDGVLCESMSTTYANTQAKNMSGRRCNQRIVRSSERANLKRSNNVLPRSISSDTPIRSTPRLLRVWFAPWEDSDGDLHEQSYLYLAVDSGRWLIEHSRPHIQNAYDPVR